jgi:hypothetical protein
MVLIEQLALWAQSKSKIFGAEGFEVSVSPILGNEKPARYVEIFGNGLLARATVWVSGEMEMEALSESSGSAVIQRSHIAQTPRELDDQLNWWLSEIAIYSGDET